VHVHLRIGLALLAVTCVVTADGADELAFAQRASMQERVPGGLAFTDHGGARVRLGRFFDGQTPVVLTLCTTSCGQQLHGLALDLQYLARDPQLRFRALTVSIDPNEAAQNFDDDRARFEWTFLRADTAQARALARVLGTSHSSEPATFVLDPHGRIVRRAPDDAEPRDLWLTLRAASR
jgi:cytochrome oxidase Cu insertion factor (SCO1/SenC/PrrC family)